MEKDLSFQILDYIDNNTANFSYCDIKTPFLNKLITKDERLTFKLVLKELKKRELINIDGFDFMHLNATQQGDELIWAEATGGHDFIKANSLEKRVLTPLDGLKITARITIPGQKYFQELSNGGSKSIIITNKNDNQDQKNTIKPIPETLLKGLFKDGTVYNKVIGLMISKGLISHNFDGLTWRGIRLNRKYEVVAFCDVLYSKGLLNNKVDSFSFLLPIFKGTFIDFSISDKTFRHKNISVLRDSEYENILSGF